MATSLPNTLEAAIKVKSALDGMRSTEGWKVFNAFISDQLAVIEKSCANVKTGDEAMRICGQISALINMRDWPMLQSNALDTQIKQQQPKEG